MTRPGVSVVVLGAAGTIAPAMFTTWPTEARGCAFSWTRAEGAS